MLRYISLLLLVYSFWNINTGSLIFIVSCSLFNIYILLCNTAKIHIDESKWTKDEIDLIKNYHLYFRYPFASKSFSATASGIYVFGLVLFIWLMIHGFWIKSGLVILNSLIAMAMQSKLNPLYFLHNAVEKQHKHKFAKEMELMDSVCKKMFINQQ